MWTWQSPGTSTAPGVGNPSGSAVTTHFPLERSHATVAHGPGSGHGFMSLQSPAWQTPATQVPGCPAALQGVSSGTSVNIALPATHESTVQSSPSLGMSASSSSSTVTPALQLDVLQSPAICPVGKGPSGMGSNEQMPSEVHVSFVHASPSSHWASLAQVFVDPPPDPVVKWRPSRPATRLHEPAEMESASAAAAKAAWRLTGTLPLSRR